MRNVTQCQWKLVALGYDIGPNGADGKFGVDTLAAYNHFLASKGRPPVNAVSMAQLNRDLFPEEQQPPPSKPIRKPGLLELLALIPTIVSLSKGKTMKLTADQITGVIRAILAAVSGFFIAKGAGDADLWNWIIAGVTGIIPVVWTWINNRPKVIEPMGK